MTDVSLAATGHAAAGHCAAPASPSQPDPFQMRRHWPDSEKARLVSETFLPGASINAVAVRHGVAESTLRSWRKRAARGNFGPVPGVPAAPAVVPVVVDDGAEPTTPTPVASTNAGSHQRRRRWPVSEKARIVAESFAPGSSLRSAARRHGVSRSTLDEWRALAREGKLGPVPEAAAPATGTPRAGAAAAPRIDGPAPSPSVTVEAGEVVVRLPRDCPAERIVAVASGLRRNDHSGLLAAGLGRDAARGLPPRPRRACGDGGAGARRRHPFRRGRGVPVEAGRQVEDAGLGRDRPGACLQAAGAYLLAEHQKHAGSRASAPACLLHGQDLEAACRPGRGKPSGPAADHPGRRLPRRCELDRGGRPRRNDRCRRSGTGIPARFRMHSSQPAHDGRHRPVAERGFGGRFHDDAEGGSAHPARGRGEPSERRRTQSADCGIHGNYIRK